MESGAPTTVTRRLFAKLFPHEPVYLLLWLGLLAGLIRSGTATAFDVFLPLAQAAVLLFLIAKPRSGAWLQARLWFPVVAIHFTYFWMGGAVPRLGDWRADSALLEIDRLLFGKCLAHRIAPAIPAWGLEILSAAYLSYFPLWASSLFLAMSRGPAFQRAYFGGFHLIYAIGFTSYALFPAAGPFLWAPLAAECPTGELGFIAALNDRIVRAGCNGIDVFPSLHTGVALFILLSARSTSRRLFAFLLVPCLLIFTATLGLKYHYAADLAAGALLAIAVWWFTVRKWQGIGKAFPIPSSGGKRSNG